MGKLAVFPGTAAFSFLISGHSPAPLSVTTTSSPAVTFATAVGRTKPTSTRFRSILLFDIVGQFDVLLQGSVSEGGRGEGSLRHVTAIMTERVEFVGEGYEL